MQRTFFFKLRYKMTLRHLINIFNADFFFFKFYKYIISIYRLGLRQRIKKNLILSKRRTLFVINSFFSKFLKYFHVNLLLLNFWYHSRFINFQSVLLKRMLRKKYKRFFIDKLSLMTRNFKKYRQRLLCLKKEEDSESDVNKKKNITNRFGYKKFINKKFNRFKNRKYGIFFRAKKVNNQEVKKKKLVRKKILVKKSLSAFNKKLLNLILHLQSKYINNDNISAKIEKKKRKFFFVCSLSKDNGAFNIKFTRRSIHKKI
jgi:hypothetical protein